MTIRSKHQYAENYRRSFAPPIPMRDDNGKVVLPITCAFCAEQFSALRRSFMGTGRKCPSCGALHRGGDYTAVPLLAWITQRDVVKQFIRKHGTRMIARALDDKQNTAA